MSYKNNYTNVRNIIVKLRKMVENFKHSPSSIKSFENNYYLWKLKINLNLKKCQWLDNIEKKKHQKHVLLF